MQNNKLKIAVVMGGRTSEHEISIVSGTYVVKALEKNGHKVIPVIISRDGKNWKQISPSQLYQLPDILKKENFGREIVKVEKGKLANAEVLIQGKPEMVFIAMHGMYGEDGTVQGLFELMGLPYVGSGVLVSALGMNKMMFRKFLDGLKIKYPSYQAVKKLNNIKVKEYPVFVKPNSGGSSVGTTKVKKSSELKAALELAFKYDSIILIDKFIEGREFTCGVIGNEDKVEVLPVVEILSKNEFFDYEAKYKSVETEEIVPAKISARLTQDMQNITKKIFAEIGAKGMARVDFIVDKKGRPFVLEINTIPGLTPMSLLPKAAKAAGYSYEGLIEKIVRYSR